MKIAIYDPRWICVITSLCRQGNRSSGRCLGDEEIIDIALHELKRIMTITKQPNFSVVTRYKNKMPQNIVGHINRINNVHEKLSQQLPGILLAGNSHAGVGVPNCIDQGKKAVEKIINHLQKS